MDATTPIHTAVNDITRQSITVANVTDYEHAATFVTTCKTLLHEIEDAFNGSIQAAYKAHKTAIAARDRYHKAVKARLDDARKAMSVWASCEESKRLAAQAVVSKEAAEQSQAHAAGDPLAVCAPIVPTTVPEVSGVQQRRVWRHKIVDETLLPREYLIPDAKKIASTVKSLRQQANIAGVQVWQEVQVV